MPKLKIEQIAICPPAGMHQRAMELLEAMGLTDWAKDHVVAEGQVYGCPGLVNAADLAFNYEALKEAREFELLHYTGGDNWMDWPMPVPDGYGPKRGPSVSHFGMHVTAEELEEWRQFFNGRGIKIAQQVNTVSHTNPVIAGKRFYNYVIFSTRGILGVDIKLIVRREVAPV